MEQRIARVGDLASGHCDVHDRTWTGAILTGSNIVAAESQAVARLGDTGNTDCSPPHPFQITQASSVSSILGVGIALVGDTVEVLSGGDGVIISGETLATSD